MQYFVPTQTGDFELMDSGNGQRLEKWGKYILIRPDPQAIWLPSLPQKEWSLADAIFDRGPASPRPEASGLRRTSWKLNNKIPQPWVYSYPIHDSRFTLRLLARLTPFKHTGVFPEQAANWEYLSEKCKEKREKLKVLNLFAYTGAATILLAKLGCQVTHVDASKPALAWAKENAKLNNLANDSVRWILDDAIKFVKREVRRGSLYDGMIMDPPAFGHGPSGKTWKFAENLPELLSDCVKILSPNAKFVLINAYATNSSAIALQNVMEDIIKVKGNIAAGELCLKQKNGRLISTGIVGRWEVDRNEK